MTAQCLFLTHPEVVVDPSRPITRWSLSDVGRARAHTFARALVGQGWELIVSSQEQKAVETAEILGEALGLPVAEDPELGENDRSATGFLPPEEFERTADRFFARPDESVRGWETAASAQRRIVAAVRRVSAAAPGRRIVFVGHGAVGGLLLGDLTDLPISRDLDQPRQGSWFQFDATTWSTNDSWRALPDG